MPTVTPRGTRRLTHAALQVRRMAQYRLDQGRVITRKELTDAARAAIRALELRPSLRLVLWELVSCWGEQTLQDRIIVWPSNERLVDKTGLSERSIRYAVAELGRLKLLVVKDSANGKRYAVRDAAGELVEVFGFDLTPLYSGRGTWREMLAAQDSQREAQRRAFDEITICRRATEAALGALAQHYPAVDRVGLEERLDELRGRTPRRVIAVPVVLDDLVRGYQELRQDAEERFYTAGNGGSDCRHIETSEGPPTWKQGHSGEEEAGEASSPIASVEFHSKTKADPSLALIVDACPALAVWDHPIKTETDLVAAARYVRGSLGAHPSAWEEAVAQLGMVRAAITVAIALQLHEDDVASGANRIRNPGGYFRTLVRLVEAGRFNLHAELLALRRRHMT